MMLTTWVISIWVARQLGPDNYGVFSLVLWLTGTISWLAGMGLIHAVTKFIAEYQGKGEKENFTPIVIYVLKIELIITLSTTLVLLFFTAQIADYFFSPKQSIFFFIAVIGLIPGMVTAVFSAAIEGIQRFQYFTWSNLILSPVSFAAKVIVLMLGRGTVGLLVVMLVFSFINCVFYYVILRKEGFFGKGTIRKRLDGTIKENILQYNRSILTILLCDKVVWDKSENFFLGRLCSSQEVGFYNLGFNIAQRFITILPSTLWRVLFPAMSSYFGSDNREKMRRLFFLSTRYLAFVTFPIGMAGIILAYEILHFLYGHQYIGAQRVLQIIFAGSMISTLSQPASAVLYGFNKQAFIYKFGAVLAVFNLLLDFLIIKRFGATGAALCYGITTAIASTGGLIYTCKIMKLPYPVVSLSKIFFATVMMAIVMEIIIIHNGGIPGFILSIAAGTIVYLVSSLVLGTFEQEDYDLLKTIANLAPGYTRSLFEMVGKLIMQFKSGT